MIGDDLYKCGYGQSLLKCVTAEQAQYIIKELYEGICGYYFGAPWLPESFSPISSGQPWRPTAQKQEHLHSILSPWPFAKWGMDILGPFSPGRGQVKFLIVVVDYFTKWIEAKPLATITAQQVQQFVCKDIICRYGVPHTISTDNGR